ncbi:hypothetical protein EJ08DRAFT_683535 [Tothia fuscella]|uniref:Uncharacterized protein n=1 Tax=Tothia fuscella TaxID=1048955 RepID=A0A9P4NG42_9PEZI|nr:hypothetical protein EJ08DRAFT_683535 [Tothia fuscella]
MAENKQYQTMEKIRQYAQDSRRLREQEMDVDSADKGALEARLDHTIRELQERLKTQQAHLEKLRATTTNPAPTTPSSDPKERLLQLHTIKTAYQTMTPQKPVLPTPGSLLPTLLATRTIQQTISDTKKAIEASSFQLETTSLQLTHSETQLSDSRLLNASLEARTARLNVETRDRGSQSDSAKAKDLVRQKQKRKGMFEKEIGLLRERIDEFVESHLAAMLAAEELGGPVVGELQDVDEDMLTAGFSAQGKPKTGKGSSSSKGEDKRQRRIDDIWGTSGEERSEKDAAAEEVRGLLEELLMEGGYVDLERDSAAARFLVRAKVAVFNPKDARKIRLIDFGREMDE